MIVFIPVEIAVRELSSKVYLCHHLASHGIECYLGSKNQIHALINKFKGFIYLDKGYHHFISERIYSDIKKRGGLIVSLDEEGAVDYPDGSILKSRYAKSLFDNADLVLMWGKAQFDLVAENMTDRQKVKITGHPRFEMLNGEFQFLYEKEAKNIKEKYNDFILVNTNMSMGNNIRGTDFIKQNYGSRFADISKRISLDKEKLSVYVNLVKRLTDEFAANIVIRPHPEEDLNFYLNHFSHNPKVEVTYEGSVIPWILASDLLIHPDCTTGIESLFLGKKSISFLPEGFPMSYATKLPLIASQAFTDMDKLLKFINIFSKNKTIARISEYQFAEEYFSFNTPSTKTIAEYISRLDQHKPLGTEAKSLSFLDKLHLKYKFYRGNFSKNLNAQKLYQKKISGLSKANVNTISSVIAQSLNLEINLICINDNLFQFTKLK